MVLPATRMRCKGRAYSSKYLANMLRLVSFASLGAAWGPIFQGCHKLPTEEGFSPNLYPAAYNWSTELIFISLQFSKEVSLVAQMVKNLPAMWETHVQSLGREDPLENATHSSIQQPTPIFLPGEFHGQRSLAGDGPQGCKESDTSERLTCTSFLSEETVGEFLSWVIVLCLPLLRYDHSAHLLTIK